MPFAVASHFLLRCLRLRRSYLFPVYRHISSFGSHARIAQFAKLDKIFLTLESIADIIHLQQVGERLFKFRKVARRQLFKALTRQRLFCGFQFRFFVLLFAVFFKGFTLRFSRYTVKYLRNVAINLDAQHFQRIFDLLFKLCTSKFRRLVLAFKFRDFSVFIANLRILLVDFFVVLAVRFFFVGFFFLVGVVQFFALVGFF